MEDEQEQDHPTRNLVLSVCDLKQHGDVPNARCGAQTVTMATRMYLHGGCDEKQSYGDLHLLEIELMKWTQLQTEGKAPPARWGHSVAGYNADLVLFGGMVGEEQALLSDSGGGVVIPPFAAGMNWAHSGSPDSSVYMLNTGSLEWQMPPVSGTPPSPRFYHGGLVVNDTYVVFGGCGAADFSKPTSDIHLLDLRGMSWNAPAVSGEAPPPRFAPKMILGPDEQVFVFGGTSTTATPDATPGTLYAFKLDTGVWSKVQVAGTPPLERNFHTFDLIGKWGFVFSGTTCNGISDLYILDVPNMRWARPLYEGQVNVRAHASSVLHDKLIVFGGVRDRKGEAAGAGQKSKADSEPRISKKLFFLNVLEVKGGVAEGDFKFKLVTVGDSGVGKSCLLTRFVQDFFADFHVSTIGVDFKTVITMVKGRLVKLQLWDTAGQERFSVVTGNYYRNSDGFIFVYDATSRASFDHVEQWLGQVQQHHECGPNTIKILVANKSDLASEVVVSEAEGQAKATAIGAFFVATSAKTAANVDMAFLTAAQNLVETRRRQKQQPKTAMQLGSSPQTTPGADSSGSSSKAKCCAGGGSK
jgi:Ras-related protein Rab-1A